MDEEKKYCLCCGEDVPCNVITRDERKLLTCAYCGFTLGVEKLWKEKDISVETYALIAEDSDFARKLLKELVSKAKLASVVIAVSNGLELITEFKKLQQYNVKIGFAIIDITMPVMDGLTAASIIRSLEEDHVKVPIVFFSAVKADEDLRRQMKLLAPAHYLNKGSDPDPRTLINRIHGLLDFISQYYQTA